MEVPETSHRKLSYNKSDSLMVVNNDRHHDNRRKKSVVGRVSSLPGESSRQHLSSGGGNLKRSRSSRRSHRSPRSSPRNASTSSEYNGGVTFSTPSMAKAELLLQNSNSNSLRPHSHHHNRQEQLEIGEPLTNYSGASITSLKLSTPPSFSHSNRQSFRAKPRKPAYGNRGRRASAWSGEQMRGDFSEIVHKIVNHPQSIVSFSVILVVVGVLLIVIALSSNSNVMNYIGIGFIVLGVLIFVIGAAWFYSHSKDLVRQQAKLNGRANLRLISLQALEEEKQDEDEENGSDTPAEV